MTANKIDWTALINAAAADEKATKAIIDIDNLIKEMQAEIDSLNKQLHPALTWNLPKYHIAAGTRKGANEIYFNGMPGTGYIQGLKDHKFRWNSNKKCWYGFSSEAEIKEILTDYENIA